MVEIPETILFGAAIGIFIPLFIFLIKMIMETANTKTRLDKLDKDVEEVKEKFNLLTELQSDIKVIKNTILRIEKDIVELFRRGRRDAVSRGSTHDERQEETDRRDEYDSR